MCEMTAGYRWGYLSILMRHVVRVAAVRVHVADGLSATNRNALVGGKHGAYILLFAVLTSLFFAPRVLKYEP